MDTSRRLAGGSSSLTTTALQAALESLPPEFPTPWASDWGQDQYGLWMGLILGNARQVFRWIPPGRFTMGSPLEEAERMENESQHEVVLTEGFWIADTVCTQALWEAVIGKNPSTFKGAERPVEQVSWADTTAFMTRLNERVAGLGLRLPTEAEWEYACRAGTQTPFWFGHTITTDQANYDGNYPYADGEKGAYHGQTVEVKALPCNGWGLYQMHGNVLEWCNDWYGGYPKGPLTDPQGPASGERRVLRGGSWSSLGRSVRAARRIINTPDFRYDFIGFRLARGQ